MSLSDDFNIDKADFWDEGAECDKNEDFCLLRNHNQ